MLHPFRKTQKKKKYPTNNKSSNQDSSRFFIFVKNQKKRKFVSIVDLKYNLKLNFLFSHFNKVPRACPENHYKHFLCLLPL